jgi:hypothetical protein
MTFKGRMDAAVKRQTACGLARTSGHGSPPEAPKNFGHSLTFVKYLIVTFFQKILFFPKKSEKFRTFSYITFAYQKPPLLAAWRLLYGGPAAEGGFWAKPHKLLG